MSTNLVEIKNGTTITWSQAGGSDNALTLANLATAAARQGAKADLGTPRAAVMFARLTVACASAPTANTSLMIYLGFSPNATAGDENPGGMSGTDAAYTGNATDIAVAVKQLMFIGEAVMSATTNAQVIDLGPFTPWMRYASPVLWMNDVNQALGAGTTYKLEIFPILDEIEAAA